MSDTVKMDLLGMTQYDDFVEKFKPKKTAAAQARVFTLSPREMALVEMLGADDRLVLPPRKVGGLNG